MQVSVFAIGCMWKTPLLGLTHLYSSRRLQKVQHASAFSAPFLLHHLTVGRRLEVVSVRGQQFVALDAKLLGLLPPDVYGAQQHAHHAWVAQIDRDPKGRLVLFVQVLSKDH